MINTYTFDKVRDSLFIRMEYTDLHGAIVVSSSLKSSSSNEAQTVSGPEHFTPQLDSISFERGEKNVAQTISVQTPTRLTHFVSFPTPPTCPQFAHSADAARKSPSRHGSVASRRYDRASRRPLGECGRRRLACGVIHASVVTPAAYRPLHLGGSTWICMSRRRGWRRSERRAKSERISLSPIERNATGVREFAVERNLHRLLCPKS